MNYQKNYDCLIRKHGHKIKPDDGIYYERHHIIPRCLGGSNKSDNLIYLNARCHLLAHWLLFRANKNNYKLTHAFAMMCEMTKQDYQKRKRPPLHVLAEARKNKALAQSKKLTSSKIEFLSEESKRKGAETRKKNGSSRGLNNGKSTPVDVYNYFNGELIASKVSVTEWGRNNGVERNLYRTLNANRTLPSSSTNRHHAKGYYIVKHGDLPYLPKGGNYKGPYSNQGHVGLKKRKDNES